MKKRFLSAFLAFMMVFTMLPMAVAADSDAQTVSSTDELLAAIEAANDGDTITLGEGTFIFNSDKKFAKKLTFVGSGDETVCEIGDLTTNVNKEQNGSYIFDGSDSITFKDMTLKSDANNYRGFIRINNTVVENCTLEGRTTYWGWQTATFTNCTFNAPQGDYAVTDYSSPVMTFNGCTFNVSGKTINAYVDETEKYAVREIVMNDCKIISTKANKAVVNIKNAGDRPQAWNVEISGTTVEGLAEDATTGSALYQVEGIAPTDKPVTVSIDGETVWKDGKPYEDLNETNSAAKITVDGATTYYKTLTDAYAALPRGKDAAPSEPTTIEVLKDSAGGGMGSDADQYMNYVIDFGGHTYTVGAPAVGSTGTVSQGLRVTKTSTAKFLNGTLKAADYKDLIQVVHTYGNVTFEDFTVDATEDSYAWAAVEPDAGTLNIEGNSSILARNGEYGLYAAFWHYGSYDGTVVNIDTTGKITGKLAYEFDEDKTGDAMASENKGYVNIKNGFFDVTDIREIWTDVSSAVDRTVGGFAISGGYFNVDPSEYKADGKYVVASDKDGYKYMITDTEPSKAAVIVTDNTAVEVKNDNLTQEDKTAIAEKTNVDGVAESVADSKDAIVKAAGVDASIAEDKSKLIEVDVQVNVAVEDVQKTEGEDAAVSSITFTATPVATVKVNGIATGEAVNVPNSMLNNQPITVKLPLPAGFTPKQIKHISADGSVEYFINKTEGSMRGASSFEVVDGCAVFTITRFSKFEMTGTVTYVAPSSSGGSSSGGSSSSKTTYKVSTSAVANGGVNVSPSTAAQGDKVKITLSPNKGYKLGSLTVTDASGKTVSTTKTSDTVYTFTMPASQVTVGVTYVKADETEQPSDSKTFSDVASTDWFADAVKYVSDKGLMNGVGNNKFAPQASTTRGMLMTVIARYAGADTTGSDPWYQKGMEWAKANGVSDGTAPNANITREQLVTMLYRYAKSTGKDVSIGEDTNILSYTDATTVSQYAIPAMQWACGEGIINGSNGKLNPQNNATRAEVAAILMRFCENVK